MIEILLYFGIVSAYVYFVPISKSNDINMNNTQFDYFREKLLY